MAVEMAFNYTQDWFSSRIPLWEKHLLAFKGQEQLRFLEIGCFEGRSTVWLLENMLTHPSCHITVVDTFQGGEEHTPLMMSGVYERFQHNLRSWSERGQVTII